MDTLAPTRRRVLRLPHIRAHNRAAVLHLLRRHRRLSRAEIARRTGLSEGAISRIVAELRHDDLIVEQGGEEATGGRPGIRLQLNESRFQAIGVDVQNWETRISVGTVTGRILENHRFRTPPGADKTLELIADQVESFCRDREEACPQAVGISLRGLVNSDAGVLELGNNPAWVHVPFRDYLSKRLGKPVIVDNNVRAAALAEYCYGTLEIQGSHCLLFVMVGEGIGMGIVLDGKLYRGPRMAAGEFGQMVIDDSPGPERHDRPGCVENLASNLATVERYQRLVGGKSRSNPGSSAEQVKRICHLAMDGDLPARKAVTESARSLGIGIANAIWSLDAEAVVIDGALTDAWSLVSAAIRDQFADGRRFLNFRNLVLRPSSLGGDAAIIGAFTLPFAGMFSTESAR